MTLHTELQTLVRRYGVGVLGDADGLRASLDDFLDEDAASPGEINLVVDALRLGGYQRLTTMLDNGADPQAAVEAAGTALARERGGDVASAQWACAVLGFAVGRIPEDVVARYQQRIGEPPDAAAPPPPAQTVQPSRPPVEPTLPPRPPPRGPAPERGATLASGWQGVQQAGPAGGAPPPKRSRLWIPLTLVAALIIAATVAAFFLLTGGEDPTTAADEQTDTVPETTNTPDSPPPTPPTSSTVSAVEVANAFAELGTTLEGGTNVCHELTPLAGQSKRVRCPYYQRLFDVEFIEHESLDELLDSRRSIRGSLTDPTARKDAAGHFYLDASDSETTLYWDSTSASMSGYLHSSSDFLSPGGAETWYDQLGETPVARPQDPAETPFKSADLWELAQGYVEPGQCESRFLQGRDRYETVACNDASFSDILFVRVKRLSYLKRARDTFDDDASFDRQWTTNIASDGDEPAAGALIRGLYKGKAIVYWDNEALNTYGLITGNDADIGAVKRYWKRGY